MRIPMGVIGMAAALATSASAQTIIQHANTTHPTNEGFTAIGLTTLGYPTNDAGTAAWAIDDNTASDRLRYSYNLSGADTTLLSNQGWQLTWRIHIISGDDTTDNPSSARTTEVNFGLNNGGGPIRYNFHFGLSDVNSSNATVALTTDGSPILLTVPGTGIGFHTWELRKLPGIAPAGFYVDGTLLTNYTGFSDPLVGTLYFGSVSEGFIGHSNWNQVLLEVPEPSTLGLLTSFGIGAVLLRRHKRSRV